VAVEGQRNVAPAGASRAVAEELPDWSYQGLTGPSRWGSLHESFSTCTLGRAQSPVDLTDSPPQPLSIVGFNYSFTPLRIVNNGHTIQVNNGAPNSIVADGIVYSLREFHFHTPSEHTVNGQHAPMELHLVHADPQGRLAMVGVLIQEGEPNAALEPVWSNLPTQPGQEIRDSVVVLDLAALLPDTAQFYRYMGSMTIPPCTEGVKWIVLRSPITLDGVQIGSFRAIVSENARPVQPLNGRTVRRRG